MTVTVPHALTKDEAKRLIRNLLDELKKQYSGLIKDYEETWNQFTGNIRFSAKNFDIVGSIEIKNTEIAVKLKIPLFANIFRARIKLEILTALNKYF